MVRQLGRYEVVRKLGEGGMGAVFLARDTATGEQVALKVLSDACLKQPGAFERFEKEARLLEEAHNPHIANMLDLGSDGDTRFLVMEFVDGCDLRRWLDNRGQLDETTALDIVSDLCRALSSIHSRGMVHQARERPAE
jgi:serine/threonine protein kinase